MSDAESSDNLRPLELRQIRESGAVAGRDIQMMGTLVAGRDFHWHAGADERDRWSGPFQLPPDIADFTGRDDDLWEVRNVLERARHPHDTAVAVSAIAGKAGVGKTALATRVAHQVRGSFPDGQLYVNLRGVEAHRLEPADVLDRFLRALGVDGLAVPETLEERRDLFRTRVADRRVLVVLDNAAEEAQVQPLLPSSAGSAALITSRMPLSLEGVHPIRLDVLEVDEALELLSKVAGPGRVTDDQLPEARRIVELCGRLPLAVRIAGAKLQARPHWSLKMLADRLADERTRLDELRIREVLEVRASFALTYQHLEESERRAFRLLGLIKAPDFAAWVAAALLSTDLRRAEDLLESLCDAQVLEVAQEAAGPIRYRLHDLLRVFARERLGKEEPAPAQEAALQRAFDAYLALAGQAAERLEPGVGKASRRSAWVRSTASSIAEQIEVDPAAWFAVERVNLVQIQQEAYDNDVYDLTWELAGNLTYFFWLRNHWSDWKRTQTLALSASRLAGRRAWEADALRQLGGAYLELEDWENATACLEESHRIAEELGDERLRAWALLRLGDLSTETNSYEEAVERLMDCLAVFEPEDQPPDAERRRGSAWARFQQGVVERYLSRYGQAAGTFEQVLPEFVAMRDPSGEATTRLNLGIIEHIREQLAAAHDHLDACLPIFKHLGDRRSIAYTLGHIGRVHHDIGIAKHKRELSLEALQLLRQGLEMFLELQLRGGEAWTLLNLGVVHGDQRNDEEATTCLDRSLELCVDLGDVQMGARVRVAFGDFHVARGRFDEALDAYDTAAAVLVPKGDELWHARLLRGRGLVAAGRGETTAAVAAWREAAAKYRTMGLPAEEEVNRLQAELVYGQQRKQL